jgi:rhamnose utilization protein RhaD (predicted bifunctional aldolase and dehydrogenase)
MKSGWVDSEAQAAIDRYARDGISRDLALRVYTTRLIGRDPKLVLHGGGNTSVKTTMADLLGEEVAVLCVKGSGSDMAAIEPAGLPAVRLDRLCKLRACAALTDEELLRIQRASPRRRIRRSRSCYMRFCRTNSSTIPTPTRS